MIKLYQKSSTGKTKFLELSTDGSKFITTWGLLDGKTQTTEKICEGMNIGKSNETSPEQQAVLEMEAKAIKKQKEGYSTTKPDDAVLTETDSKIDLDNLPINLCPSKPIGQNKLTVKITESPDTYGQRKHNGHCLILVRGTGTTKIYTRRMQNITEYVKDIPVIKEAADKLPLGSFVLHECVYYNNQYQKEMPRFVAQVITKEDAVEAFRRYVELSKAGKYSMIPIDALFLDNKFIGDTEHRQRMKLMMQHGIEVPGLIPNWKDVLDRAKAQHWEGLVLRVPGKDSYITYTMDGKAKRAGGWKYKFVGEGDFVVSEVLKGESGKHADFYAKFKVHQYDATGAVVDRGYVGAGTLTHEDLKKLKDDLDSGKRKLPFVVEIEYQSIHDESGKLEFGQIQRIRDDKLPSECLADD